MASRPVFYPELGQYFVGLREARGWTQGMALDLAARRKIALTTQALRGLEEGRTKSPEPDVMRAVGLLYDVAYETIAATVIQHRYGLSVADGKFVRLARAAHKPAVDMANPAGRLLAERRQRDRRFARKLQKSLATIAEIQLQLQADADAETAVVAVPQRRTGKPR